eukprot:4799456-Amphidinium_carterae.1
MDGQSKRPSACYAAMSLDVDCFGNLAKHVSVSSKPLELQGLAVTSCQSCSTYLVRRAVWQESFAGY